MTTNLNLTEAEIMELVKFMLYYNPETGWFTWLINRGRAVKGKIAGSKNAQGYIDIKLLGKTHKAHRLAFLYMTGKFPANETDHINGIKYDNRWVNLREATGAQNRKNIGRCKSNSTGFKGVTKRKNGRFLAQIVINNKKTCLGVYGIAKEASEAYQASAKQNHGNFYCEGK